MAPAPDADSGPAPALSALRCISFRLSTAHPSQLPHIVSTHVGSLADCAELLSSPPRHAQQSGGASGVAVHRLFSQIATLLQGRHAEERWAAAVLIKAVVEAGGYEVLNRSKHWVAGLLANLRKHDPPASRVISLVALTRLFVLTRAFPSLLREITTPSLPQFVKVCLANVTTRTGQDRELGAVLGCFCQLIGHHPTIFRSFSRDIGSLLDSVLDLDDASLTADPAPRYSRGTVALAARLLHLLHCVEPKQGAGPSWDRAMETTLAKASRALDAVLVGVEEHLDPNDAAAKQQSVKAASTQSPQQRLRLVMAHASRLVAVLDTLSQQVAVETSMPVTVPIGTIDRLVQRILSVVVHRSAQHQSPRLSLDIGQAERDFVLSLLPRLHTLALDLIALLFSRVGPQMAPLAVPVLEQIVWLAAAQVTYDDIRAASYRALTALLQHAAPLSGKEAIEQLGPVLKRCCEDFQTATMCSDTALGRTHRGKAPPADLLASSGQGASATESRHGILVAAKALLETVYAKIPAELMPASLRTPMDRVAILTQQRDLLAASVLNPARRKEGGSGRSLLPFLIQADRQSVAAEAIVRPRMPILQAGKIESGTSQDDSALQVIRSSGPGVDGGDTVGNGFHDSDSEDSVAVAAVDGHEELDPTAISLGDPVHNATSQNEVRSWDQHGQDSILEVEDVPARAKRTRDDGAESREDDGKRPRHNQSVADDQQAKAATGEETAKAVQDDRGSASSAATSVYQLPQAPVQESDDEDFVIPELTMDVSDDEEED